MTTSKLAHYRRKRGLSQEQLATLSGVSARTIQRIESGKVEAHPSTLKILADSLEIETFELTIKEEVSFSQKTETDNKTITIFHILALIGLCFPIFNIILPGLFWFFKKDESQAFDLEGMQVINFQITMSIIFVPAVFLMIFVFDVGFPLVLIVYFYAVFMGIYNIFRAINKKKTNYPLTCKFLK